MTRAGVVSGRIDQTRVRGLLFDVDGTLSDTDDHLVERLQSLLKPVSRLFRKGDTKRFSRWMVMAMETPANFVYGLTDRLGIDRPLALFYNRISRRRRSRTPHAERFWIIPGVKEMLATFHGQIPMAVVSARDAETTALFLDHFNLRQYFDAVVTAHTTEHTKPFPDPVQHAARQLGLRAADCVMVGDTIVDVYAGKSAGAQTVAVLCGFGRRRELVRAGADLVLTVTSDLTSVLPSGDVRGDDVFHGKI